MLSRAHTFTVAGLHARHVTVEVDVRRGLPAFAIVGLGDTAVREARERVHAAILNSGFEFPSRRITANLAPGDVPKAGAGFDLAIAIALLAASGQLSPALLDSHALFGELALGGAVRGCRGTLSVAQATQRLGLKAICLAGSRAPEAALVAGLDVAVVDDLCAAVRVLSGGRAAPLPAPVASRCETPADDRATHDLVDVQGQRHAVDALVIAAAGGHNMLLSGPPGTGKTMLAQRLPSILPALTAAEALEVTRIHSVTSGYARELVSRRPFRAPHHSITAAGLVGGAQRGWIGEIVLAHNGVLFLDELSEFARPALEALRQPLEEGRVAVVRARHSAVYPARFMLLAATNPCPCGYAGDGDLCRCSEADRSRHRRRLSGPLLDRVDLLVHVLRLGAGELRGAPGMTSSSARDQVTEARERQAARLRDDGVLVNSQMDARTLRKHVRLDPRGEEMMRLAGDQGLLSARGHDRVLRVARTIGDLDGREVLSARDVGAALSRRPDASLAGSRAA